MQLQNSHISCGVQQVYSLEAYGPGERPHLYDLLMVLSGSAAPYFGMVVFSDADVNGNGEALATEITDTFGTTGLVSASCVNPNSGNAITTWIWAPNWRTVSEYMNTWKVGGKRAFSRDRVQKIEWSRRDEPEDHDDEY